MTACVNKKSKRVAAVVTASLVGALSIGAPAVALAANGGIELMAATSGEAYNQGIVAEYKIGTKTVAGNADVELTAFEAKSGKCNLTITKVLPAGEKTDTVSVSDANDTVTRYFKVAPAGTALSKCLVIDGVRYQWAGDSFPTEVGEYVAVTRWNGEAGDGYVELDSKGQTIDVPTLKFSIVANSLKGAEVAAADKTGEYTDTSFSYDNKTTWNDLKIAIDGVDTKVPFTVYAIGSDKQSVDKSDVLEAGSYRIVANTSGTDFAGQTFEQDVTVSKLDLAKADLSIDDRATSAVAPTFADVNGLSAYGIKEGDVVLSLTSHDIYQDGKLGAYTYKLSLSDKASDSIKKNVEGTATLTFNRVVDNAATVTWRYKDRTDFNFSTDENGMIVVDRSVDEDTFESPWTVKSLDLSDFKGTWTDVDGKSHTLTADQYKWTIKDSDGNVVSDLSKKGVYKVTLEADSSKLDFAVDRSVSKTFTVSVKQGTIGKADVVFTYNGKVVTDATSAVYDGEDYLPRIGITVKDSKGNTLVAGTDYKVVVKKGGKAVDKIVDASDDPYIISIESDTYDVNTSNKLEFTVNPLEISDANLVIDKNALPFKTFYKNDKDSASKYSILSGPAIPYTGNMIDAPVVAYTTDADSDGTLEYHALPTSAYTLTYKFKGSVVEGMKAAGKYTVEVNPVLSETNYSFSMKALTVEVKKDMNTGFVDNADEEWFAEAVNKAQVNGYLSGRGNTGMVTPKQNITRADAVVVLFKMAAGTLDTDEFEYDASKYYETGFADVDGRAYYANAIAWAKELGIANGSNGNFRPEDNVTREEFAALLSNYAIAKGDYVAASDDALAGMPDASSVSPWFTDAVSWAVENGIMGNGGKINAQSNILRAEVASMAVSYQPGLFA